MYLVKEIFEGKTKIEKNFKSFNSLKDYLIQNTDNYFGWIRSEEPEKELPNFSTVKNVREIKAILNEYDYSWWRLEVEVM